MQLNVDIRLNGLETFLLIGDAVRAQPFEAENVSCGYNNITINYQCGKKEATLLKSHWKSYVRDCIITAF
jgi:hypothetical protein